MKLLTILSLNHHRHLFGTTVTRLMHVYHVHVIRTNDKDICQTNHIYDISKSRTFQGSKPNIRILSDNNVFNANLFKELKSEFH